MSPFDWNRYCKEMIDWVSQNDVTFNNQAPFFYNRNVQVELNHRNFTFLTDLGYNWTK